MGYVSGRSMGSTLWGDVPIVGMAVGFSSLFQALGFFGPPVPDTPLMNSKPVDQVTFGG